MIHLERTSLVSDGKDTSQFSYQVHYIDTEDKLSQLIALEQQLELTEKRFQNLQNYVEYIRTLYHGSIKDPSAIQVCSVSILPEVDIHQNDSFISVQDFKMDDGAGGDSSRNKSPKKKEKERRKSYSKRSPSRRHPKVSSRNESRSSRRSSPRKSPRRSPSRSQRCESVSRKSSRKTLQDEPFPYPKRSKPRRYYDDGIIKYRPSKKIYYDGERNKKTPSKRILTDENSSKKLSSRARRQCGESSSKRSLEKTNQNKTKEVYSDDINRDESFTSKVESNDSLNYKPNKSISRRTIESVTSSREPDVKLRRPENSLTSIKSSIKARSQISPRHTYLKPTLSSQMKRMRSPVTNFNFRSIPFVAGKAVTKSHNLGVKIQETLSIIKRNTPTEVSKQTGDHLVAPRNVEPNHISRCRTRQRLYETKSRYHSRSTTITSKPATAKSCSTLSNGSSCTLIDELSDSAETNIYLKKALMYMQADFTETLDEYKVLSNENNPKNADRIKEIEYKLDRKEEVIKAFSKLYAQVAELKKKLEQISFYQKKRNASRGSTGVSSSYPAVKLTRLLRKIQEFQNKMQGFQDVR